MSTPPNVWVVRPEPDSWLDTDPYVFDNEKAARSFARFRSQDPDAVVTEEPILGSDFVIECRQNRRQNAR